MCNWRAHARILRIGICRPEQERGCDTNAAGWLSDGGKNLLHKDHRFWHSTAMRKVGWDFSDHHQPATSYRARINNFASTEFGECHAA